MKILVYGATGSQQGPLIPALLKRGHSVRAITRQQNKVFDEEEVETFVANMDDYSALLVASKGIDVVCFMVPFFISDPSQGFALARKAIDAALESGVKLLVWNTCGFIPEKPTGNLSIDVRIDVLEYLKACALPFIAIQPSIYAENLLGPWTAPGVKSRNEVAYPTPPDMRIGWIATKDVAELIAESVTRMHLAGSLFKVSGAERLSGPELALKFSIGLGREIRYRHLAPDEFARIIDQTFGPGAGKDVEAEYEKLNESETYPQTYTDMTPVLHELPVSLTPIEEWVNEHAYAFSTR